MVIEELVRAVLEFIGVKGIAIGALVPVIVGLYYLREVAELFVVLARYARILSLIGVVVLVLYIAGTVTGYVDASSISAAIRSLTGLFGGLSH